MAWSGFHVMALALCLGAGCGARTGLLVEGHDNGDAGGDADSDVDGDTPWDADVSPCSLDWAGDPFSIIAFPEGGAHAPDLVLLAPGDPDAGGALVVLKAISADASFWHPEIRVARLAIGLAWPDGVVLDRQPTLFGFESHEWGSISLAAGDPTRLALFWHYAGALVDPPSLRFQTFDLESWSASAPVDVSLEEGHEASLGLSPGRGVDLAGAGYAGNGYGVAFRTWRETEGTLPQAAILNPEGSFQLGPFPAAPPGEYPGRGASIVWTGTTYLVATSFIDCPEGWEGRCAPGAVGVLSIRPPIAPGDPGGLELVSTIPVQRPGLNPLRPHMAERAGSVWLSWFEVDPAVPGVAANVVLARVSGDGLLEWEAPRVLATDAAYTASPSIAATAHGIIVMWGAPGDASLPPEAPGSTRLIVHHLDFDGVAVQAPLVTDTTSFAYYADLSAVGLAGPAGVLLAWSARGASLRDEIFLGRLDCVWE
jgi:hypothetical protein